MKITAAHVDEVVLAELGTRLAQTRLERNLTQEQVAAEAGISKATLERLEAGRGATMTNFIRALRVLDLLDALDAVVPEPTPSPIERLKMHGRERRRAAPRRSDQFGVKPAPWVWGDATAEDDR